MRSAVLGVEKERGISHALRDPFDRMELMKAQKQRKNDGYY